MENWEIVRANALEMSDGNVSAALDLASRECARLRLLVSAGLIYERPQHSSPRLVKPKTTPILIHDEAPHG